jgi:type I restriction enzyme M protein
MAAAMDAGQIGKKAWSYAGVLMAAGLSNVEYVEQLTMLLFLKMADQLTEPPHSQPPIVPPEYGWKTLMKLDGAALEAQYSKSIEKLALKPGMLGVIFKGARCDIHNPALLKQLIVNLIDKEDWMSLPVDVKGTIYEELLQRSASESTKGAGQYFTTRAVIQTMVDVMEPTPQDRICDPAAGTGGFLFTAYKYVLDKYRKELNAEELRTLREELVEAMELSPKVARMCAMNLYLHGIGGDKVVVHSGHDSLAAPSSKDYSMILANPPFGKSQSVLFVNEKDELEKDDAVVVREDFWTETSNKQLNFVQHMFTLLRINGRAAVVLPDNVLFEGGAGEKVRRNLLEKCNVHTILRLPTGIWYSPGVKANVVFFDKMEGRPAPWTDKVWVYDLRTNKHFTQKQSPITRRDFDEFVQCYRPGEMHKREATWSEANPDGRWRCYTYEEILKRDKLSLDLFWIKDQSLTDTDSLPPPDVLAAEIADELEAAHELFSRIAAKLPKSTTGKT